MADYSIQYTDEALQDLRDIYDYISFELKAPGIAAAQIKRIRDEIRSLNVFPNRYRLVDWEPWTSRGMRQMPVDHFIVFYVVSDEAKRLQIIRALYGKRDIPNAINRGR